jgi:hypothetical protein
VVIVSNCTYIGFVVVEGVVAVVFVFVFVVALVAVVCLYLYVGIMVLVETLARRTNLGMCYFLVIFSGQ